VIFPILRGLLAPRFAPVTFLFFALNLIVFLATFDSFQEMDTRMDEFLGDHSFIQTQGLAFAVMIERGGPHFSGTLHRLATKALSADDEAKKILGSLAVRNVDFMNEAQKFDFGGDEVAIRAWREKFAELLEIQNQHPSYQWGLSRVKDGWIQYLTYQFSHSGFLHLFWNMVFLLIFGVFLESELGPSFVAITYVGSGFIGACSYALLSGVSSSPLVGASASVSGLMSLVGLAWFKKEKVRFFYWLLPIQGYFGFVALPSWVILIISFVPDLSGYLGASREFGSVAYSAHIGGALFGALIAVLYRTGLMHREVQPASTGATSDSENNDHRKAS